MLSTQVCFQPGPFGDDLASDQFLLLSLRVDNFIVVESHVEFWLKDFEIDGGVILLTLTVGSVKDYVVDSLIDKVFLPLSQPYHEVMAR